MLEKFMHPPMLYNSYFFLLYIWILLNLLHTYYIDFISSIFTSGFITKNSFSHLQQNSFDSFLEKKIKFSTQHI